MTSTTLKNVIRPSGPASAEANPAAATGTVTEVDLLADFAAHVRSFVDVAALAPLKVVADTANGMGGLVARCALEDPDTAARIATLVTLGSPHAGSHLARFGATARTLALRPGSPLQERLAGQVPWEGPPRLVCFWSPADVIMLPATTAQVP